MGPALLREVETMLDPAASSGFAAATIQGSGKPRPFQCALPTPGSPVKLPDLPDAIATLVAQGVAEDSVLQSVTRLAANPDLLSPTSLKQFTFAILGAGSQVSL